LAGFAPRLRAADVVVAVTSGPVDTGGSKGVWVSATAEGVRRLRGPIRSTACKAASSAGEPLATAALPRFFPERDRTMMFRVPASLTNVTLHTLVGLLSATGIPADDTRERAV
jgi:hypothetical protein